MAAPVSLFLFGSRFSPGTQYLLFKSSPCCEKFSNAKSAALTLHDGKEFSLKAATDVEGSLAESVSIYRSC